MYDATRKDSRHFAKWLMVLLVVMGVFGGMIAAPKRAEAATLKSGGANFTLKKGVDQQVNIWYAGVGPIKYYARVANYQVKDAKPGYKTMTCKVIFTRKWTPTKAQVKKILNANEALYRREYGYIPDEYDLYWGGSEVFLVDYNTGANLATPTWSKKFGVYSYSISGIYTVGTKRYYYGNDGEYIYMPTQEFYTVKVTYKSSYTGLCLGVGGGTVKENYGGRKKFDDGKVSYMKSWWCKYNNRCTRFMRVK